MKLPRIVKSREHEVASASGPAFESSPNEILRGEGVGNILASVKNDLDRESRY